MSRLRLHTGKLDGTGVWDIRWVERT